MCRFCTKHGDGKKWYLQAENYAFDLQSDLRRREFVVDFVRDFDSTTANGLGRLEQAARLPGPLRKAAMRAAGRQMQPVHYGQPVPLEDCEGILDITTSIVQIPCVCRHFVKAPDNGYCLAITTRPVDGILQEAFADYEGAPDMSAFQNLTREETLALLRRCEGEGMLHSVWTFITPFIAGLCNCNLASGCMAMRVTLQYDMKAMWKGEYVAGIDVDLCEGCRQCVEICPFEAIQFSSSEGKAAVDLGRCYGCGICRAVCPADAISLTPRADVPAVANDW